MVLMLYVLLLQAQSIDITLTSTLTNTTTDNYEISNNILSIISSGNYIISGSCSECQINIKKGLTVNITLNSITIDNSNTGPFVIKKNAVVNLILQGESRIEDNEAIENEDLDDFEGAGIKFKSSSSLTISGTGKLTIVGNPKNGIKGASLSNLTINGGVLDITSANNAIACDNILTINGGTFTIKSQSDGIKSEPDSDDADSKGMITINGGKFTISSVSDAIQAAYKLIVNGGNFNIKTKDGAETKNFDKDNDSAKGLKCSTNEHENVENILIINGGNFVLDTADDAIHSDFNLTITGGTFEISTGDDGVHADQYLELGKLNADNSLINLKVKKSYEGLEGSYINLYSGTYNIISSDDGINTAGDVDCGENQAGGKTRKNLRGRMLQQTNSLCGAYHMNIYGGEIYVNAGADGLDSNGNVVISGGNIEVWGAKSGADGDPIDKVGTLSISGATVLAGGNQGMNPIQQSSTINQKYIYTTQSYSANKQISILDGEKIIRNITIPKNVGYIFYTSKDTSSNYKFSEGTSNSGQNNNIPNQNMPPNQNSDMPNNMPPNQNSDMPNNMPPNQNSDMPNNMPPNQNSDMPNNMPPNRNSDMPNNMPPNQNSDMPNNMPPNRNSDMPNNMPPNQNSDMPNNMPPNQNSDMPNNMPPNQNSDMPNNMPPNQNSDMPNNMPPNPNNNSSDNEEKENDDNNFIRFSSGIILKINSAFIFTFNFVYLFLEF